MAEGHLKQQNLIEGRTVILIGNDEAARIEIAKFFQGLSCEIKMMDNSSEALESLTAQARPDILILASESSIMKALPFIDQVSIQTDATLPVFLVTNSIHTDTDIDEAFFRGVEAVFFHPLQSEVFLQAINFALEMHGENSSRQHRRRRVRRAKLEYLNESTGLTSSGYVVNISEGGMYVCSMYNHPEKLHRITFRIHRDGGGAKEIIGSGLVRWLRPSSELGRPPGFGVEFKQLDSQALQEIHAILDANEK
jgi:CheY-like chemotaxis protein